MTSRVTWTPAARTGSGRFDPLRATWSFLTNVKVALTLIGLTAFGGLLGIVIPQMPAPMRGNPAARQAWLELQREDFGAFTTVMERLQLFEVFYSPWFNGLWVLIIAAVSVSTVSRFRPTARSVHRPPRRVAERYFEVAHHRADFTHDGGAEALAGAFRARRFRVQESARQGDTVYLFAERYPWAAYGTFLSHLALVIFMVGGLLTRFAAFDETLALREGAPGAPVFAEPGPGQLFVRMDDAHRGVDGEGNIVDFHSILTISRGEEVVTCKASVNDPCRAFGYKFHQAAFFDDIAALQVRDPSGRVLYDDAVDFEDNTVAVPVLKISGSDGGIVFEGPVPQMGTDRGSAEAGDEVATAVLPLPNGTYLLAWRVVGGVLRLSVAGGGILTNAMAPGQTVEDGAYRFVYAGSRNVPAIQVDDMPGADGPVTVQLLEDGQGLPYLFLSGLGPGNVAVRQGEDHVSEAGYTYEFGGRVEASGINIRRDPGDTFIWIAAVMALTGLGITFYVPRRRVWAKVTPERTYLAGIAEKTTRLGREFRLIGRSLGSTDALRPGDVGEDSA